MKPSLLTLLLAFCLLNLHGKGLSAQGLTPYAGTWTNQQADIFKITIEISGDQAWVKAWGNCEGNPCEIGMVNAEPFTRIGGPNEQSALTASIQAEGKEAHLMLQLADGEMQAQIVTIQPNEAGQSVRTRYMAIYEKEEKASSNPGMGGIYGPAKGPARSLASMVQVQLLDASGQRLIQQQPLNADGYEFAEITPGTYLLRFVTPGSSGLQIPEKEFEIEVQAGVVHLQAVVLR